jgi:mRNA interferase MazF
MPKPSEIILIEFPFSSLAAAKRRPALIIHGPTRHGDILALALTSKAQHTDSVAITQDDLLLGTLAKPSWVRCDQLHTFDQSLIRGTIAILSPPAFASVRESLCGFLGCRPPA